MSDIEPCRFNEPGGLTVNELVGMIQDGGESLRFAHAELIRRHFGAYECGLSLGKAEARVAELEADLRVVHDQARDQLAAVHILRDGQTKYLEQQDKHLADLQAQLERANGRIEIMHTLRSRMQEQLDRATEPRAYGMEHAQPDVLGYSLIRRARSLGHVSPDELDDLERFYAALDWFAEQVKSTKPRPMSEAPRDGTWVLVAVQVRPDKHRWRTAHWDSKLGYWIEGGRKVLRGLREPVAWQPQALVPTSSGGGDAT